MSVTRRVTQRVTQPVTLPVTEGLPSSAPSFIPISATGGTVTDVDIGGRMYRLHTFTTSGDFDVTDLGTNPEEAEGLWVGGGASGGHHTTIVTAQGSGAGGEVLAATAPVTVGTHTITIGAGGSAVTGLSNGNSGSPTSGLGITAQGGGYGGYFSSVGAGGNAPNGGGGPCRVDNVTPGPGGTGLRNGGNGYSDATSAIRSGGGGAGAGSAGGNASAGQGGAGGDGVPSDIDGTLRYYGAGAGGMGATPGAAGLGGEPGVTLGAAPNDGTDGIGNGGTGSSGTAAGVNSGKGGSGRFVIRYPLEAA